MRKIQRFAAAFMAAAMLTAAAFPAAAGEWVKENDVWTYRDDSGNLVKNDYVDGFYLGADGVWVPEKDSNYYMHNVHEHYETVAAEIYRGTISDYQNCWQMRAKLYAWYHDDGPVKSAPNYETTLRISKDASLSGFGKAEDFIYTVENTDDGFWYLTNITQNKYGYIVEAVAAWSGN